MPRNRTDSQSSRSSRAGKRSRSAGPAPQHKASRAPEPKTGRAPEHKAGRRDVESRRDAGSRRDAESERLQKVLARAGLASRREAEDWIRAGRITINGEPAVLGVRVTPSDQVRLDGRLIRQVREPGIATVFLIHRSPGEPLQQHVEGAEQPTSDQAPEGTPILDRIPRRAGRRFISVSPMPRVDGGLELVTSDGDLASRLQRSMRNLTSEFSVRVHGELSPQGLETILEGMLDTGQKLEVERCVAAGGEGSNRWYSLAARGVSGKDVRQLFERQGALVSRIMRTTLGPLALDRTLSRGRFRELSVAEVQELLRLGIEGLASDASTARAE